MEKYTDTPRAYAAGNTLGANSVSPPSKPTLDLLEKRLEELCNQFENIAGRATNTASRTMGLAQDPINLGSSRVKEGNAGQVFRLSDKLDNLQRLANLLDNTVGMLETL